MIYKYIREEELKNKVGEDWFKEFDTTEILGNIDFTVFPKSENLFGRVPLLWAEAKTGDYNIPAMFVQLILTIGKARTFDKTLPPGFLGAFDYKKIAFVPYNAIQDIFYLNDFNWNVTPSNHETKEFQLIKERIEKTLQQDTFVFEFEKDEVELQHFIKKNVTNASIGSKIKIDKNNFIPIYLRWLEHIKPTIDVNWEQLKKINILDSDFYLADLFVNDQNTTNIEDDTTIRDNLFVIFENQGYKIAKENLRQMFDATIPIKNKEIYTQFWKLYKRPPLNDFHDYIIERRDLLVPQDIRERKGAFFTPRKWVELSQKYLSDYLGDDWQEEYYVWDCAAGTGNLLAGLTNKYNLFASTLDMADVNVMQERIEHGANLLRNHVFQFDFLNDEFIPISLGGKIPDRLYDIIQNEKKRKKLVVYINPPYAEVSSKAEKGKIGVNLSIIHTKYKTILGTAGRELFAQFLIRIYSELNGVIIGEFSTLKILQGSAFLNLKNHFQAKLEKIFVAPANSFDNVKGQFPIGFKIWNTNKIEEFKNILVDVYDINTEFYGTKNIYSTEKNQYINKFISVFKSDRENNIGFMDGINGNDFQHNNIVYILNTKEQIPNPRGIWINKNNLIPISIYFSVRKVFKANWLNDRDQFLYPNDGWKKDKEFQYDCLTYSLFNNNIQIKFGINHWIPFTEKEVEAHEKFESNFMTDFIKGKIPPDEEVATIFTIVSEPKTHYEVPLEFSEEAKMVFDTGRKLWKYYHKNIIPGPYGRAKEGNVNASLYDIREFFQGRNDKGRMNPKSEDAAYNVLIAELRNKLSILADKIKPKVYEYGFLME